MLHHQVALTEHVGAMQEECSVCQSVNTRTGTNHHKPDKYTKTLELSPGSLDGFSTFLKPIVYLYHQIRKQRGSW